MLSQHIITHITLFVRNAGTDTPADSPHYHTDIVLVCASQSAGMRELDVYIVQCVARFGGALVLSRAFTITIFDFGCGSSGLIWAGLEGGWKVSMCTGTLAKEVLHTCCCTSKQINAHANT